MVDDILERLGDARFVLLGEATHGTHEFYAIRAEVTKRLIAERGFRGVAVEADWPAASRVDRYVQGAADDADAVAALGGFVRFPQWMWRNHVVAELVEWLRAHGGGAGFYGLDLYSLRESIDAVLEYLRATDPDAAERARRRYACFDHLDPQEYGHATTLGAKEPCEDAVVAQLTEMLGRDGRMPFGAHQNARIVAEAERYYRAMFRGRADSWNLRDTHMADTLDSLADHLGEDAGIVVWAHNSHVGDARATSISAHGELNLGQLVRTRHGGAARIIGFTTHAGAVTAARDWGDPAERRRVVPSLPGSLERELHDRGIDRAVLAASDALPWEERLQRMIGVVYRPETERASHYVDARATAQFDVVVHVDETTALEPLEPWAADETEPAETYPTGL